MTCNDKVNYEENKVYRYLRFSFIERLVILFLGRICCGFDLETEVANNLDSLEVE